MAAKRWLVLALSFALSLAFAFAPSGANAQARNTFSNPAEYDSYMAALNTRDAAKRATAMEVFIAWYPGSTLRIEAFEQAIAAWHAASQPAKADVMAVRLLQLDPDNVRALANRAYAGRTRAAAGEAAALPPAVAAAERGLAVLPKWQKPLSLTDAAFARVKEQMAGVFHGTLGFAALQAKDYAKARRHYRQSVLAEPDNLQDVYQFAVVQLEGTPLDALGFWYGARAIVIARAARNEAATDIDRYVRARYRLYRGSEEGWDALLARIAAGERAPPANFAKSIPRALTPPERAQQLAEENDPATLSFAEWALVLRHRDATPANKAAAEKVWQAIVERQRGGGTRLKIPVKVIAATPDRIDAAITDEAQAANTVDLVVTMARPLGPLPAVGAKIAVVGTLSDYRAQPFAFLMTRGELAPESLPVAGGRCADPRPQMCSRDYRPACGLRRDGSRKTYGNACSACADPDVVTQDAGACP